MIKGLVKARSGSQEKNFKDPWSISCSCSKFICLIKAAVFRRVGHQNSFWPPTGDVILSAGKSGLIAVSSAVNGETMRIIKDHKGAAITSMQCVKEQVGSPNPVEEWSSNGASNGSAMGLVSGPIGPSGTTMAVINLKHLEMRPFQK